jgi:hypothetical protein
MTAVEVDTALNILAVTLEIEAVDVDVTVRNLLIRLLVTVATEFAVAKRNRYRTCPSGLSPIAADETGE